MLFSTEVGVNLRTRSLGLVTHTHTHARARALQMSTDGHEHCTQIPSIGLVQLTKRRKGATTQVLTLSDTYYRPGENSVTH